MVGKNVIQIAGNQFSAGLGTSDYLGDGGIGTDSQNINLVSDPGVVRATYSYAQSMPGGISPTQFIASAEDASATTSNGRIAVDMSGNWYKINQSGITSPTTGSGSIYFNPVTDMVAFNNFNFATTSTNMARFNPSTNSLTENYWQGTCGQSPLNANVPHSLLVYQNLMFLASGNKLYSITTGDVATLVLTLDASEIILSLGIDPGSGLMILGVGTVSDGSETYGGRYYIELYDGYSAKVRRKIPIEGRPNGFQSVGGPLYASVDNTICLWNGNGMSFLRRLKNVTYSSNTLVNRHRMTTMQNTLLVADGSDLIAYGDVQNGKKVWYPLYTNSGTGLQNDVIAFIGNNTGASSGLSPIVATFTTASGVGKSYYIEPLNKTGVGSGVFSTNNIFLERPVHVNEMEVFTTGISTTAGIGGVAIIDESNNVIQPEVYKFVVTSGTQYRFLFKFGGTKFRIIQPRITIDTQSFGIVKANIYYEPAE